jgi:hypothetical protein
MQSLILVVLILLYPALSHATWCGAQVARPEAGLPESTAAGGGGGREPSGDCRRRGSGTQRQAADAPMLEKIEVLPEQLGRPDTLLADHGYFSRIIPLGANDLTAWLGISDSKCAGRPARSSR